MNSKSGTDFVKKETKEVYRLAMHHKALFVLLIGLLAIASVTAYSYNLKYANAQSALKNAQFTETSTSNAYAVQQSQLNSLKSNNQNLNSSINDLQTVLQNTQAQQSLLQLQLASSLHQNQQLNKEVNSLESQLANYSNSIKN